MFLMSENLLEHTDLYLTEAIRVKTDISSLTAKIVRALIGTVMMIIGVILVDPGLENNVSAVVSSIALGTGWSPIFDWNLVFGVGLILIKTLVVDIVLDKSIEEAHTWVKKVHKSNNAQSK